MAPSRRWLHLAALLAAAILVAAPRAALSLGCTAQPGGSVICELPVTHDSIVAAAHNENNHGGEPHLWVKVSNGINRAFERIDLSALAGRTDILTATLRHYIYKVGDGASSMFAIHAADPSWLAPFEEGKDRFQAWGYCSEPDWKRNPLKTGTPGVTFKCPVDPLPNDANSADCPVQWTAGFPGFLTTPLDLTQRPADPPNCNASLDCFFEDGNDPRECWNTFEFDVTDYIAGQVLAGKTSTDVMIRREPESGQGGVWWFSTEGAVCVLGATDPPLQALRPVLIVELAGGPVPSVPAPPDPCN